MTNRDKLELQLDAYLNKYISKRWIKMTTVLRGMKQDLTRDRYIDRKSFKSVLGLLRKEPKFITFTDSQITDYFAPLFQRPSIQSSSLEQFLGE